MEIGNSCRNIGETQGPSTACVGSLCSLTHSARDDSDRVNFSPIFERCYECTQGKQLLSETADEERVAFGAIEAYDVECRLAVGGVNYLPDAQDRRSAVHLQ